MHGALPRSLLRVIGCMWSTQAGPGKNPCVSQRTKGLRSTASGEPDVSIVHHQVHPSGPSARQSGCCVVVHCAEHCAERQIFSQDGSLAAYHMHKHFTVDVCAFRDVLF